MVLRKDACSRVRAPVLMAALVAALLCLPAVAKAAPPDFTADPDIKGDAIVGSTLQALANSNDPAATVAYQWLRCGTTDLGSCIPIGTDAPTYVLASSDLNMYVRVRVTLTNLEGTASRPSAPQGPVAAKPVPPPPPPPPPPTPTPIPPTVSTAASLPAGPAFLRPFPIVRIRGFFAKGGARITLLSVKGPRVARVQARCIGRGCPVRTLTMFPADGRLHRFERFLRAGIKLQIRVTRPGRIGSYTSFLIRSRKAPVRTDRCLSVKTGKPILCSAP